MIVSTSIVHYMTLHLYLSNPRLTLLVHLLLEIIDYVVAVGAGPRVATNTYCACRNLEY